jgi:hypothetical protein
MNVSTSWLIYILLSAITFFILSFIATNLITPVKLLISLLVGALAVFLSAPSLDIETGAERMWLGILLMIAYIAPILIGLYIIWRGGYFNDALCVEVNKVVSEE